MDAQARNWRQWHLPLSQGSVTLEQGLDALAGVGAAPKDIPLIVRLVENPRFAIPGIDLFHGAVDLRAHDCIHLLLGRGLLAKDEAFVIGFTMGSTQQVSTVEERLFALVARRLYPGVYRFTAEDIEVFRDAVRLGALSRCRRLDRIPYGRYRDRSLDDLRREIGIETGLLRAYYEIEARRYPQAPESRRLCA